MSHRRPYLRPTLKGLTFCIFNKGVRFRLDGEGGIMPCSNCGIGYFRNAWEVYCSFCIAEFEREREESRLEPDQPLNAQGVPYGVPPDQSETCVRCRVPLGDCDDHWRCEDCLLAKAREENDAQLSLDFPTARAGAGQSVLI